MLSTQDHLVLQLDRVLAIVEYLSGSRRNHGSVDLVVLIPQINLDDCRVGQGCLHAALAAVILVEVREVVVEELCVRSPHR